MPSYPPAWSALPLNGAGNHYIDQSAYDAIRTALRADTADRNAGLFNYANIGDLYVNRIFDVSGGQSAAVSSGYNFASLAQGVAPTQGQFGITTPGGTITAGVTTTATLTPVPPGINGADLHHDVYLTSGTGTAEVVRITGGTAVSGGASGTITFVSLYAHSGAWKLTSATAGIMEAFSSLGTGAGLVFVPMGAWGIRGQIWLQYTGHQLCGAGAGATVLNKLTATGDMITAQATAGSIYYNRVSDLLCQSDAAVTPTGGAMVYTDSTAISGRMYNVTAQKVFIGLKHFGQLWQGSNIEINDQTAAGTAFWLRGGNWGLLECTQNAGDGIVGGTGLFVDNCDGLFIVGMFIQGQHDYGIEFAPGGGQNVRDVQAGVVCIDLFRVNAIYITGSGQNELISIGSLHLGNQTPHASNGHAFRVDGQFHDSTIAIDRIFNNQKRGISLESASAITGVKFQGGHVLGNSLASSGTYSGLYAADIVALEIHDVNSGARNGASATQKYGIELSGTITDSNITGNVLRNNVTAPILYPTTLTNSVIANNVGEIAPSQVAYCSGSLTLVAGAYNDLTGATLTIARPGTYRIEGVFDFNCAGAGDVGVVFLGQLVVNGVAQANLAVRTPQAVNDRATVAQQWLVVVGVGQIVKLQAEKTAGSGTSTAATQSSLAATWVS